MGPDFHPSIANVLRFFAFDHLPERLQEISRPFAELAVSIAGRTLGELTPADGPETTVALRKLLEAKDAAVRAALGPPD